MSVKYEVLKKLVVAAGHKKALAQRHNGRAAGKPEKVKQKESYSGFEGRRV